MLDLSLPEILCIAVGGILLLRPEDLPALLKQGRKVVGKVNEVKNDLTGAFSTATKDMNLKESIKLLEQEREDAQKQLREFELQLKDQQKQLNDSVKEAVKPEGGVKNG